MNKKFSKLTALILTLSMALSLVFPAWAFEDTDPPQWEKSGYSSLEEFLTDWGITEEEYYEWLVQPALEWEQLNAQQAAERQAWMDAHPEEVAAFDPYAYFAQEWTWYDSAQEYMEDWHMTEEEFRQKMLDWWVDDRIDAEEADQIISQFQAAHPDKFAAFDPYIYFESNYFWYDDAQEYMELWDMTEEEFQRAMLLDWIEDFQNKAQEKELLGGSADGINVMVNGRCVSFSDARPEQKNQHTMVPLAALVEHLGGQVGYDRATGSAQVTVNGLSFTHVIGSDILTMADGSQVKMDVPSYTKNQRTMVSAASMAQLLGYEFSWDSDYETAVMLDLQGLIDEIDSRFTLVNRVLYAASGAELAKEGQSLERGESLALDITLFDTLHGDKKFSSKLTGSMLWNDSALEISLSGDLSALLDCFLETVQPLFWQETDEEFQQLRTALSKFSIELIVNLEQGVIYFRCPSLAGLEILPLEDPNAWAAIPLDLSELSGISLSALLDSVSIGHLSAVEGFSPFWTYSNIVSTAEELAGYVGDDQFKKSGSSYTMTYSFTDYDWEYNEITYTAAAKITPSGEKSCTFSFMFDAASDDMVIDVDLTGSSGKTGLTANVHLKNLFQLTMSGSSRTSAVSKQPRSAPPAGSKIEFPLGPTSSSEL